MARLSGRTAIITGGAKGIGRHYSLAFAAEGKVRATIETLALESINDVFERLRTGRVSGRVVLGIG